MSASAAGGLFAGVGRSDITPAPNFPNGMWMAQKHLRGGGIHRRLFIQCVIIGADDDAVALLNYDLCILSAKQVSEIRARPCRRASVYRRSASGFMSPTNHAAPVTQDFYDREEGADEVSGLHSRATRAQCQCRQGSLGCKTSGARRRNGSGAPVRYRCQSYRSQPSPAAWSRDLTRVALPIRRSALSVSTTSPGGRSQRSFTYGCHPTYLGPTNTLISPDYPGVTRDVFESLTGTPCIFLQAGRRKRRADARVSWRYCPKLNAAARSSPAKRRRLFSPFKRRKRARAWGMWSSRVLRSAWSRRLPSGHRVLPAFA